MEKEPIKTQLEADRVFASLCQTVSDRLNIDIEQATKRLKYLYESGIMESNHRFTQRNINEFLSMER